MSSMDRWPRVAFVAHALLPNHRSSKLIDERLEDLGLTWPKPGDDPGFIKWFSFPVVPRKVGLVPVWVDFYIVPVMGPAFFAATGGDNPAYGWAEAAAIDALQRARLAQVPLTIGWGAFTKNATDHGTLFLHQLGGLQRLVSTTNGDPGTTHFVLDLIRRSGFKPGFRVAVVGASGVIGELLARSLPRFSPERIVLIGKPDKDGATKNLDRLTATAREIVLPGGQVFTSQNALTACREHEANLVIVATNGDIGTADGVFPPTAVWPGTVVLDITTPAACRPDPLWENMLVLTAGSGRIDPTILPEGFGQHRGKQLIDVGGGGPYSLWGCTDEAILRPIMGWRGHVAGKHGPLHELDWCAEAAEQVGMQAADPLSFGESLHWDMVRSFVNHT